MAVKGGRPLRGAETLNQMTKRTQTLTRTTKPTERRVPGGWSLSFTASKSRKTGKP
jgi:hypothetical protein